MVPALIGCRFVRLVPDGLHSKSLNAPRLAALIKSHKTALNVHSKYNQCSLKIQTNLSRNALKPYPKPPSHHPPCLLALSPALSALHAPPCCLSCHTRLGHWNALTIGTPLPLARLGTPYHTIPYHTIPHHTIPYHAKPHHTIPYHITPSNPTSLCMCLLVACLGTHALALGTPLHWARLGTPYHTITYHTIIGDSPDD